jgi:hypothetical protein
MSVTNPLSSNHLVLLRLIITGTIAVFKNLAADSFKATERDYAVKVLYLSSEVILMINLFSKSFIITITNAQMIEIKRTVSLMF